MQMTRSSTDCHDDEGGVPTCIFAMGDVSASPCLLSPPLSEPPDPGDAVAIPRAFESKLNLRLAESASAGESATRENAGMAFLGAAGGVGGAVAPEWSCGKCAGGVVDIDRNITYECE